MSGTVTAFERISLGAEDLRAWRRHIHANPELGFDCHETAAFVAARLREFGVDEVHEGIARTGVVAVINGSSPGPVTGLRADMDALPIHEMTNLAHSSRNPGKMHACGHDGHTAMLLGAARYLCETRRFAGRAVLLFQPAEEDGGGGRVMCEEGVMERFGIDQVFAIHTDPSQPEGGLFTRTGPIFAAVDQFHITLTGRGGHAAYPHETIDPIAAAVQLGQGLQSIVARNASALETVVVSITQIHAGQNYNIIPGDAMIGGTVRTYRRDVQKMVRRRMEEISAGIAAAMGVSVDVVYQEDYPATINHADETAFGLSVARNMQLDGPVKGDIQPEMAAEDFSYMLEERPGAFFMLGQGEGPALHNAGFDFNDDVAPTGAAFLAELIEQGHPLPKDSA